MTTVNEATEPVETVPAKTLEDPGYIDPDVVDMHIPEITEEMIEASQSSLPEEGEIAAESLSEETEVTVEPEEAAETVTITAEPTAEEAEVPAETEENKIESGRVWITRENEKNEFVLTAHGEPELNGSVIWETDQLQLD